MRHAKAGRTFNRDTNARKAKDLRRVVEKLITRAKNDTVANRRLTASELGNSSEKTVKKLFDVLGPRYAQRPGGYTRVLKAGFRYGDAAPMAIIELVDRDENAKKVAAAAAETPAAEEVAEAPAKKEATAEKKAAKKEPAKKSAKAAK